jgi:aminopeptidase N
VHVFARAALAAAFALPLAGIASAAPEPPFTFDTTYGNLPKDVVPRAYSISVRPDPDHLTLTGSEKVQIEVRKPTKTIIFNALNITFSRASVDGFAATVVPNDKTQRATLTAGKLLSPGLHVLALSYKGKMDTAGQGIFRQPYLGADGKPHVMVSTQFESTDARRMFPCWDEPAFRAVYTLSATLPAAWTAVSNMPVAARVVHGAMATTTFQPSAKMASYLVVLSAGDLKSISSIDANGTRHEVWATSGNQDEGQYALANSKQILEAYDAYFGIAFPLPKLSSIAVPGGFSGAMENWGGITYNDQILLLGKSGTIGQKQQIYSVQAHEMAHQWFGDLVTMSWWDDLWLNESFASWMSARQTNLANPTWLWWQDQDGDKEGAMSADAEITSHPIQTHVTDELQAEAAFDPAITYSKGQAFLRMTEAYLGPDTFRSGIRLYMQNRKFSNATATDLWLALSKASGKDVAAYANGWIAQPGFPVVSVTASCDGAGARTIALHQERFLLSGISDPANTTWNVPVGIASGAGTPSYTVLSARDRSGIPAGSCSEPLRANAGDIGFYRVSYDAATLATNTKAFGSLPDEDKIAMLDDQWALTQAGKADLGTYLALANAMGSDHDARAWTQIVGSLSTIERDERNKPGHDAFTAYARELVHPLFDALNWDAKPDDAPPVRRLRDLAISSLGKWGEPGIIAEAKKRFAAFVRDPSTLSPDEQTTVLAIVGTYADQAAFDQIHALAKAAKSQQEAERYYFALESAKDPKLAEQGMEIAISSEIPPQAANAVPGLVFSNVDWNPSLAFAFGKAHGKQVFKAFTGMDMVFLALFVPPTFADAAPLDQVQAWVTGLVPAGSEAYIARGMSSAKLQLELKSRIVEQTDAAMRAQHT